MENIPQKQITAVLKFTEMKELSVADARAYYQSFMVDIIDAVEARDEPPPKQISSIRYQLPWSEEVMDRLRTYIEQINKDDPKFILEERSNFPSREDPNLLYFDPEGLG